MDVLIGLTVYYTIGLVLAKVFVVYRKTAYRDMIEQDQLVAISLVFIYPLTILLGILRCFPVLVDKLLMKIL